MSRVVAAPGAYVDLDFIAARYPPTQLTLAGPGRRLTGHLIDYVLLGPAQILVAILFWASIVTLGVSLLLLPVGLLLAAPWLIWFIIVAPNGQTPGKQLLGMYVIASDGGRAGGSQVWLREFVVKYLLTGFLNVPTLGVYGLLASLWCLWDRDNRCLWDKIAGTYIALSPHGFKPLTSREMLGRGIALPDPGGVRAAHPAQPVIVINNNAQVGNNDNRRLAVSNFAPASGVLARISIIDAGRPGREVSVSNGQRFVIGRDASADIRLSDPKVSRRHVEVRLDGGLWIVRDLGATNPASLLGAGPARILRSDTARLPHGQISIGDSVITLYPVGRT